MEKYNAISDISEALNPNNQKDFDGDNISGFEKSIGRGFSKPIIEFFPWLTVVFTIQLCDHKGMPILKLQPVRIHCTLKDSLETSRVISKTKFLSKAYIEKGILIYHLDIKVASYQDVLVDD